MKATYLLTYILAHTHTHLKVRVVEVVRNVPSEHEELATFYEDRVEVAETEEKFLVLVRFMAAVELLVTNTLVHALYVSLQALHHANTNCLINLELSGC